MKKLDMMFILLTFFIKKNGRGEEDRGGEEKNNYTSRILEFKPKCKQFKNNCRSHKDEGSRFARNLALASFLLPIDINTASGLAPCKLTWRLLVEDVVASLLVSSNLIETTQN